MKDPTPHTEAASQAAWAIARKFWGRSADSPTIGEITRIIDEACKLKGLQSAMEDARRLQTNAMTIILHRHTAPEWMWENLGNAVNAMYRALEALSSPQNDPPHPIP